jgi:hypothetical protein
MLQVITKAAYFMKACSMFAMAAFNFKLHFAVDIPKYDKHM